MKLIWRILMYFSVVSKKYDSMNISISAVGIQYTHMDIHTLYKISLCAYIKSIGIYNHTMASHVAIVCINQSPPILLSHTDIKKNKVCVFSSLFTFVIFNTFISQKTPMKVFLKILHTYIN